MTQDTNPEAVERAIALELNLALWIERRKQDIGPYADHIIHSVKKYEEGLAALAAELEALKATTAPVAVVKDLEWEDHPYNGEPVMSKAVTPLGTYFICDDTDDFTGLYLEFVSHKDATWYGTVKADCIELSAHNHIDDYSPLQAAAQVDYEQRILSAITTKTEAEVREECIEDIKKARQALKEK